MWVGSIFAPLVCLDCVIRVVVFVYQLPRCDVVYFYFSKIELPRDDRRKRRKIYFSKIELPRDDYQSDRGQEVDPFSPHLDTQLSMLRS